MTANWSLSRCWGENKGSNLRSNPCNRLALLNCKGRTEEKHAESLRCSHYTNSFRLRNRTAPSFRKNDELPTTASVHPYSVVKVAEERVSETCSICSNDVVPNFASVLYIITALAVFVNTFGTDWGKLLRSRVGRTTKKHLWAGLGGLGRVLACFWAGKALSERKYALIAPRTAHFRP